MFVARFLIKIARSMAQENLMISSYQTCMMWDIRTLGIPAVAVSE